MVLHFGNVKVTTTDGEQQEDSLDLMDGFPEMSPPPCTNQSSQQSNSYKVSNGHSEVNAKISTSTKAQQHSTALDNEASNELCNSMELDQHVPPTPLVGAHQELRFTFNTGRTPPLPDIRGTDFFR